MKNKHKLWFRLSPLILSLCIFMHGSLGFWVDACLVLAGSFILSTWFDYMKYIEFQADHACECLDDIIKSLKDYKSD